MVNSITSFRNTLIQFINMSCRCFGDNPQKNQGKKREIRCASCSTPSRRNACANLIQLPQEHLNQSAGKPWYTSQHFLEVSAHNIFCSPGCSQMMRSRAFFLSFKREMALTYLSVRNLCPGILWTLELVVFSFVFVFFK